MYRSARDGAMYVFINGDDTGKRQWRLVDAGNGRVRAELVREMTFDSQTEGCVVDDDSGILYVNEEDVAMWRMSAEPDGGDARTAVDRVADNPAIRAELEGVRSEKHTSELQSLMRLSYAVLCLTQITYL